MKIYIVLLFCYPGLVYSKLECNVSSQSVPESLSNCSNIVFHEVKFFNLTELTEIYNQDEFNMIGDKSITTIECLNDAGVALYDSNNVVIRNVKFKNCGFHHYLDDIYFNAAVLMMNCTNITFRNVYFYHHNGVGLVSLNSRGLVEIFDSTFHSGEVLNQTKNATGGGGIHVQQNGTDELTDVTITIQNTNFTNNAARTYCKPTACNSFCSFGYGGGLTIALRNYSHSANIIINNCHFVNNSAIAGGGVEIILCKTTDAKLFFENIEFSGNKALKEGGGGIDIIWNDRMNSTSSCILNNVTFDGNQAIYGGGVAIAINSLADNSGCIHFKNCHWYHNKALYGSALDIFPEVTAEKQYMKFISVINNTFTSNSNCHLSRRHHNLLQLGFGVIMVTGFKISFLGMIKFSSNNGPAIFAVGTEVEFEGATVHFDYNFAEYGSCITLVGLSFIRLKKDCSLYFCSNWAESNFPMIYYYPVDKHHYTRTKRYPVKVVIQDGTNNTFYQYDNMVPSITKYINEWRYYVDPVDDFASTNEINFMTLKSCNSTDRLKYESYSPSANQLCLQENYQEPDPLIFIPGMERNLHMMNNNSIVFRVTLYRSGSLSVEVPEIYEYITDELILYGKPGSNVTVYLHDQDFEGLHFAFKATLAACPPFHTLTQSEFKCLCSQADTMYYKSFFECHDESNHSYSKILTGYWIGYDNYYDNSNETLLVGRCPIGYCKSDQHWLELPYKDEMKLENLDTLLCEDRQGVLCGTCLNDTVVYFHSYSFKCGNTDKCNLGILLFFIAEIVPVTAIFLALVFFNINLTAGGISGFIFFAQMYESLNLMGGFVYEGIPYEYTTFHHIVYQFFNFDFVEVDAWSFCLAKGLNTLNILAVKYVMAVYAFLLILITILLAKFCGRIKLPWCQSRKLFVVRAISAFIIIVYSKCTHVSFSLLWYQDLYRGQTVVRRVVSLQGDMEYFVGEHLPYAIVAILFVIFFIVPLPLVLLFYPMANKFISKFNLDNFFVIKFASKLFPLYKWLPFFDIFQGVFKENYRFFAGLYFVYRVLILWSRIETRLSIIYLMATLQFIVFLLIHTLAWPYKQRIHNIIDALLLANLAIISGLKLMMVTLSINHYSIMAIRLVHGIEMLFVYIPMIVLVAYGSVKCFNVLVKFFKKSSDQPPDSFWLDNVRNTSSEDYHTMNSLS